MCVGTTGWFTVSDSRSLWVQDSAAFRTGRLLFHPVESLLRPNRFFSHQKRKGQGVGNGHDGEAENETQTYTQICEIVSKLQSVRDKNCQTGKVMQSWRRENVTHSTLEGGLGLWKTPGGCMNAQELMKKWQFPEVSWWIWSGER